MDNRFYFCPFSHHVRSDHNSSSDEKFTTFHYLLTIFMPQWKRKQLSRLVLFIFLAVVVVVFIFTSLFSLKYCFFSTFMFLSRFRSFVKNNLRVVRENRKILGFFELVCWNVWRWNNETLRCWLACDFVNGLNWGQMYLDLNVEMMEIWWKLFSFNENS